MTIYLSFTVKMKTLVIKIFLGVGVFGPLWISIIGFDKDANGKPFEYTAFQLFTTIVSVFVLCWGVIYSAAKKLEKGDIENASYITMVYGLFLAWCYLST